MLEQQEGESPMAVEAPEIAAFHAVREFIQAQPGEFTRALGDLHLIGTRVQLFSDPNARADLLALDPQGVAVVVAVERDGEHSLLEHGLMCAGLVAGWQPDYFFLYPSASSPEDLRAFLQVPWQQVNRKQRVILVAHSHEYAIYVAAQWLAQRHGIEVCCVQGRMDAASGALDLTLLGPESFGRQAAPVETVRIVFPQPSAAEAVSDADPGAPLQPALDPLTGAVTQVGRLQTIWRPDRGAAAASIEGRIQQILDEELEKAAAAPLEAPVAEVPAEAQLAAPAQHAPAQQAPMEQAPREQVLVEQAPVLEAPAQKVPVPEAPFQRAQTPVEESAAAPASARPIIPERIEPARETTEHRASWIAGILVLAAALALAGTVMLKLRRPNPTPQAPSAPPAELPSPPPAATIFSNTVRDAASGRPIAGARIFYAGQALPVDGSGEFQIHVVDGERKLLVKAAGYRQLTSSIDSHDPIRLQPISVRGYYLSHSHVADPLRRQNILNLIRGTATNAVVLGVKDVTGRLNVAVDHPLASELRADRGAEAVGLARQVAAWKSEGIYTVALLALFKDDLVARNKPELAFRSMLSRQLVIDPDGIAWADPSSSAVRDYNIAVAKAAAAAGFDEIHFDFIRYPAESPSDEGGSPAEYERRLATLVTFLRGADRALAPYNVYVSASVFGSVCTIPTAGVVGQKIEEFAAHLDYVAPMLYPSYFEPGRRIPDPLRQSYQVVFENLGRAARRLEGDSRKLRPWLQNFPDSASPGEPLAANSIRNQVKAAEDARAGGWMLWDSRNHYRNTSEAINLLKSERSRPQASKADIRGGSLVLVSGRSDGGPPTANPEQQFRLLGVLLLAGGCLGVLYVAARAAWLFHVWTSSGPSSRQPETAAVAAAGRTRLGGRVSWEAFPGLRYPNNSFPGPLRRAAGRGADTN
jgi:hypothetical protein